MRRIAKINYIHSEEARRDWQTRPITYQMGNIGSEVSRSLKWAAKGNQARADKAIDRALELFDFTIDANIKIPPASPKSSRLATSFATTFLTITRIIPTPPKCKNTMMAL